MVERKNFFEEYGFNKTQIVLAIILVVYFLFLGRLTSPVPNYNLETEELMYNINSYAPKTHITGTQIGIGIILVIMLVSSFRLRDIQKGRVSERKFKEHITEQIKIKQNYPLPNGKYELPHGEFRIDKDIITQYTFIKDVGIPTKYIAQAIIMDEDENEKYYFITGNPVTMMIDDIIETEEPLELSDKCPTCDGRFPDKAVILVEDLEKYKKIKKALSIE